VKYGAKYNARITYIILGCKYHDANPSFGFSQVEQHLLASLEATELASLTKFYPDDFLLKHHCPGDPELLDLCGKIRPDLIILSWMCGLKYNPKLGAIGRDENPKLATLQILSDKMGIPIVAMWWDHVWDIHILNAEMLRSCIRLNVVGDTSTFFSKVSHPEKYLLLWGPQAPRFFYDSKGERDIPISFVGRLSKKGRKEKIAALKEADIGFYHTGGQQEHPIPFEEVASICRRSKIIVNFSASPSGNPQVVARVMEATLSSAMLLEEDNPETRRLFDPMVDYVPYKGVDDLVEKARYYLEHEDERAAIAESGCQRATENYNNVVFWKTVFNRVFPNQWESVPRLASTSPISTATLKPKHVYRKAESKRPVVLVSEKEAEVSILIPTLNRSDFLIRALSYYGKVGFKGWICIGDSSDVQHSEKIKSIVHALEDKLNIIYTYFPKPPFNIQMCFKKLVETAPTPYVVYSGDDDLLIPSSLARCAAFLEDHPEYIAAHGLRIAYKLRNGGEFGEIEHIHYVQQHIWESEKASERWVGYVRHAISTQYYVHRKEIWKRIYQNTASVPSFYLGAEFLPCSLTAILGKVKQLECLSTLFQIQDNIRSVGWFFDIAVHPDWSQSVQGLRHSIVEALMQQDGVNEKIAQEIFDREFWHHIKSVLTWQYQKKYGDLRPGEIAVSFNLTDSCQSVYTLITHPGWSDSIRAIRANGIKAIAQNNGVDIEKAPEIFERGLWFYLLLHLNKQYQGKYGVEQPANQADRGQNISRDYGNLLSLENLLNPESPFHKDFMPAYQIVTKAYPGSMSIDGRLIKKAIALNERGEKLFNKGDIDGALTAFTKTMEINPNYAIVYNNLGVLYWQAGEVEKAVDNFVRAFEINPNDRDTIVNCGEIFKSLGKIADAKKIYLNYLESNPNDEVIAIALENLL